jgi:hypothetical protein
MIHPSPSTESHGPLGFEIDVVPVMDTGLTHAADMLAMIRAKLGAAPARKPRKPRRPTLATVAKQANKAGIDVARYEIRSDNTIVIVTGKPEPAAPENPWLANLRKETKQ